MKLVGEDDCLQRNRAFNEPEADRRKSAAHSHDTEAVAERVAAECNGRPRSAFELLLAFGAGIHRACQNDLEIVNLKVDVNRRPVSLVSANVVRSFGRLGAGRFLDESDLSAPACENSVGRDGSGNFGQSEGVAIEAQAVVKLRNVDRHRILHAYAPTLPRAEASASSFRS